MRFAGKIQKKCFGSLLECLINIEKINESKKLWNICISEQFFELSIKESMLNAIHGFLKVEMEKLFEEFTIESKDGNKIGFQCSGSILIKAFLSYRQVDEQENGFIYLKFVRIEDKSYLLCRMRTSLEVDVRQKIPIHIVSVASMENMIPPSIPVSKVQVEIPLKRVKQLISMGHRMKSLHKFMFIESKMDGNFTVSLEGTSVAIQTYLQDVQPRSDLTEMDSQEAARVRLETKYFVKAMQSVPMHALKARGNKDIDPGLLCCTYLAFLTY